MEAGFLQSIYSIAEEFVGILLPASPHMFRNYCAPRLLESASRGAVDYHVRCNFVVMRYGAMEADFVRVSTIVCLSAHIMQKLFLTRPDDIHI